MNIQYDPYLIPPNLELSTLHARSKEVGIISEFEQQRCPCCNMPINKTSIELCADIKRLAFLGPGFPLFFQAIKFYSILLVLAFALIGIYNIVTTADLCYKEYHFTLIDAEEVQNMGCYHFIGVAYTINKTEHQLTVQAALALIGTILVTIGLFYIKYYQQKKIKLQFECSSSDFTLIMRNVNYKLSSSQIVEYLVKYFHVEPSSIVKIIRPLNVEGYLNDRNKKIELLSEQRRIFARFENHKDLRKKDEQLQKMMMDIQQLDRQITAFEQQISLNDEILRTDYVLVILEEDHEVQRIIDDANKLKWYEQLLDQLGCCGDCLPNPQDQQYMMNHRISIRKAPEPLDILWENFNISYESKRMRRVLAITLNLLIVAGGAFIVYAISYTQNEAKKSNLNSFYLKYVLSGLCALAILIINYVLETMIKITTKYEKHITFTHQIRSIVITQTIMQFINTALVPFGLFVFTDFDQNNLAASLFFIFLGNLIALPFLEILDPLYLLKLRDRKKVVDQSFRSEFTQKQANEIYEGPDYKIADKYSTIYKSVLMSFFYMCIFPYGSLLQVLSLVLYYWACKYTLLKRCAWPPNLNVDINNSVNQILAFSPILVSVGAICYDFVLIETKSNIIMHIFNLIISGICGGFCLTFEFRQSQTESAQSLKYLDERNKFSTDYEKCNPITIKQAQFQVKFE